MKGVIHKRRPHGGEGSYVKLDKCGHGVGGIKLQWTSTNCTVMMIILTFVTVYSCVTLSVQKMSDVYLTSKMQNARS